MCGRCIGEPYRGVPALFNADLQRGLDQDRRDWLVVSERVIVYLGSSALSDQDHPLLRGCDTALKTINDSERAKLEALSKKLSRPALGAP